MFQQKYTSLINLLHVITYKQTARKLERQWRSSNLEESQLVWKDSLITYML